MLHTYWGGVPEFNILAWLYKIQIEVLNLETGQLIAVGHPAHPSLQIAYHRHHYVLLQSRCQHRGLTKRVARRVAGWDAGGELRKCRGAGGRGQRGRSPTSPEYIYPNGVDEQDASAITVSVYRNNYTWAQALTAASYGYRFVASAGLRLEELRRALARRLHAAFDRINITCAGGRAPPDVFEADDVVEVALTSAGASSSSRQRSRSRPRPSTARETQLTQTQPYVQVIDDDDEADDNEEHNQPPPRVKAPVSATASFLRGVASENAISREFWG